MLSYAATVHARRSDYNSLNPIFFARIPRSFAGTKNEVCSSLVRSLCLYLYLWAFVFMCGDFYQNVKLFRRRCRCQKMDMLDT